MRKGRNKVVYPDHDKSMRISQTQFALLKKAIQLCKLGGRIVYSTCTFAPEENEYVIHRALTELDDQVEMVEIKLPNFVTCPGITQWREMTFSSAVSRAARIWPHLNNSGGFFIAVLRKIKPSPTAIMPITKKRQLHTTTVDDHLAKLQQRFKFDDAVIANYRYSVQSNRGIYLTNLDNQPPAQLQIDAVGLFFLKTKIIHPKLVTAAAMILGEHARQNTIVLSVQQRQSYFKGEDILLDQQQVVDCIDSGYVIVFYQHYPLGLGLYLAPHHDQGNRLRSLFPKYLNPHC